jgi:hypothetical protein
MLDANPAGLDAVAARLDRLAGGAWKAPALAEMAAELDRQIRAKLEGNPRATGLLANLRVEVTGDELVVTFPDFAQRFTAADFARGDFSSYTDSLGAIAARVAAEHVG